MPPVLTTTQNGVVPAPATVNSYFMSDDGTWDAVSGGYNKGTVPTVVQVAFSVNGGNSAIFSVAPTSGNLLVAMCFNPTSDTTGTGWTKQVENSGGTDYGLIFTKVA